MILPPSIQQVLETFARHRIQALLMGGQACIVYGGAEFSRDIDFAILATPENLAALERTMEELQARVIAVPPFTIGYLSEGLAVHFRCGAQGVEGLRVDVMSHMRGVAPFADLWSRRHRLPAGGAVLALPDLIKAKKTQRDKDWPMIRRLMEADYIRNPHPTPAQIEFWLDECRTPEILQELSRSHASQMASHQRKVVQSAGNGASSSILAELLHEEEIAERNADITWWAPRKKRLEALRRNLKPE